MWIRASTPVSENVYQLTTPITSHALVMGDTTVLVDAGVGAAQSWFFEEFEKLTEGPSAIDLLLLTHAEFDTVGGIPFLREKFPDLKVLASPLTAERLQNSELRAQWLAQNRSCAAALKVDFTLGENDWDKALTIDQIFRDGDALEIDDDIEVKIIATPGFTEDATTYYVRPDGALLGCEALGSFNGREQVSACFAFSYLQYLESLDKLATLEVNTITLPHSGALSGELAKQHLAKVREGAKKLAEQIKARLDEGEVVEEVSEEIYLEWVQQGASPVGPFSEMLKSSLKKVVQNVAAGK